ncbi:MAG: putative cell division protein [Alphaproteobacteria bacterium]|jgi:cell division transport system permease protein|nr:putative cell division protein [Alphaproteobacteria bacterium]
MAKSKLIPGKYQYDIGLDQGAGAHLVAWSTGLMVFFATLALAVNMGLNTVTQNWVSGLSGSLTVEIKPPVSDEQQAASAETVKKVLWMAKQHPAVEKSRALTREEILGLLRPWLGEKAPDSLPLPAIIDITLKKDVDSSALIADINKVAPDAAVDSHADTLGDVKTLVATARMFVLLLTGVIILLTAASIAGIVRSKLAIHAQEVETLHLVGASDEYIARQFRHHTLKGALKGAMGGVFCMVLAILGVSYMTHTIDTAIFPHVRLMPLEWILIAAAPVLAGSLIAHFTAQRTVMRELSRLA